MAQVLPSGRVTFAFTDVVGSTRAFSEHGQSFADALPALLSQIAEVTAAHGGVVVKTEGDGAFLAFPTADGAVRALCEIQERLEQEPGDGLWLRIRAGAHTGTAEPVGDDYLALAVHVAARVSSAAGAGQVLVSDSVVEDLDPECLAEVRPAEVGIFELKDLAEPMQLWRVAGDDAPPRATPARRTNVALPHTSFVARDLELDELHRLLETPGLVTVVGPGGVGKTRLISEYAVRNAPGRADGIWMVELAPLTESDQVLPAVALTLGMSGTPTPESLAAELARRGAPLLILDNCEHVAETVANLTAELLAAYPVLSIVATSREPLELDGERVQRLLPLSVSEPSDAQSPSAAEELFLARARTAGAELTPGELSAVAQICQLLDGLPLAVELAAARAAVMSSRDLVAELQAGGVQLRRRGGTQRQRSLEALVGWSLDLLDAAHRDALLVLSVFPGRFTGETARHVLDAIDGIPQGAVAELTRRSLIDRDGEDYRMLVTVRDVVRAELSTRAELLSAAMEALFSWAVDLAREKREAGQLPSEPQIRAFEAALAWAVPERLPGCGRVMLKLTAWVNAHSRSQQAQTIAETVLSGPPPTNSDELRLHAAAIRLIAGVGYGGSVSADQARTLLAEARKYEEEDRSSYFYSNTVAASVLGRLGHLDEALPLLLHLVDIAADDSERAAALTDVGVAHHLLGDLEQAERFYREGLHVQPAEEANYLILMSNLGEVLLDAGRLDEAAAQLREAVRLAHGQTTISAWTLGLLVAAEAERGAVEVVRALASDAEAALEAAVRVDASVAYVLDRMRGALARMPV